MGGCASRPKEFNAKQEPLLAEDSTTLNKVDGETVSHEENAGEAKKDEPSVDSSEVALKTEESFKSSSEEEAAKPIEDKFEAAVETKETVKEEEKEEVKVQYGEAPIVEL